MPDAETPEHRDTGQVPNPSPVLVTPPAADSRTTAGSDARLTADDDVVGAAQILVSYLWNTEYERGGSSGRGQIWQQLRTLTRWLTTPPEE
ncbi:hypothetical protein ACFWUP_30280 [Nocardia sp. NPDC058658]|uniref:hypothetical protein n=1 Tax=Nocardia sp. NPDC058658 TaxID=3346580 RepID=UPI00364CEE24